MASLLLSALAERFSLRRQGETDPLIEGVCTLTPGKPGGIGFLANPQYRKALAASAASAVVVSERDAEVAPMPVLVAADPYLAFARIAALFDPTPATVPGIHPSAVIGAGSSIDETAEIGPLVVVEPGAHIGAGAYVGAHSVVGRDAVIGAETRLEGRNWVGARSQVGARCRLNAGCVIGARGFGLAPTPQGWEEVPQLGRVVIGNDVEVGANTCIDRGAIDDTVISDGVKLDNLIQIAHNVHIGAHTAVAAKTGIAGSTRIGARCLIGGAVGIAGHLTIVDDVVVLARAMVTHSLMEKGAYGSGLPVADARSWRRQVAHIRRLDRWEARLKRVERQRDLPDDDGEPRGASDD